MAKAEVAAIEARCAKIAADMGFELVDAAVEKEPTGNRRRRGRHQPPAERAAG